MCNAERVQRRGKRSSKIKSIKKAIEGDEWILGNKKYIN